MPRLPSLGDVAQSAVSSALLVGAGAVSTATSTVNAWRDHAHEILAVPATLAELPGALTALNRTIRGLAESVGEARETLATVQRLAGRVDALLDEVEPAVERLRPGVERVAALLDDPVIDELPDTIRQLREDALPAVRGLRETQERIAGVAASTERMVAFVDDTTGRLAGLPGAGLFLSRRAARLSGEQPGTQPRAQPPGIEPPVVDIPGTDTPS